MCKGLGLSCLGFIRLAVRGLDVFMGLGFISS